MMSRENHLLFGAKIMWSWDLERDIFIIAMFQQVKFYKMLFCFILFHSKLSYLQELQLIHILIHIRLSCSVFPFILSFSFFFCSQ